MKDQKLTRHIINCIVGTILVITGILLAILYTVPQDAMVALPFVLGGMGLVALVGGIGGVLSVRIMNKDPNFAKQVKDFYDERAIVIEDKAKAKTSDFTTVLLWVLIIFLAMMQVQLLVVLVFVGAMVLRMLVLHSLIKIYSKKL